MAASSQSCGVCDLRLIIKPSIVWCTECNEGLCTECKEHHSLSNLCRSHYVLPFIVYHKLAADILKTTHYCTKHDENECIFDSHKECRDFVELNDAIHNIKTFNAMCQIEETLLEVAENLQNIRQHQQDSLTTLKDSRKKKEKEIKTTRTKINSHLDKLQENLIKQPYDIEINENSKICQLLSSVEKQEKEIAECKRNIMNIKQHATEFKSFFQ
ncbi:unnamed protein product [Mytilus edulis]|uniref:B box-type domain-containing protein n=1 Tax=Mytilus edulis TaxID=6550 RepID=A0A8S3U696_MYTED|nr:unnamed protein product [Mytilus edulis]